MKVLILVFGHPKGVAGSMIGSYLGVQLPHAHRADGESAYSNTVRARIVPKVASCYDGPHLRKGGRRSLARFIMARSDNLQSLLGETG